MAAEGDRDTTWFLKDVADSARPGAGRVLWLWDPEAVRPDGILGSVIGIPEGSGSAGLTVRRNGGADVGPRPRVNLIEGESVSLTAADDAEDAEIDITIAVPEIQGGYF